MESAKKDTFLDSSLTGSASMKLIEDLEALIAPVEDTRTWGSNVHAGEDNTNNNDSRSTKYAFDSEGNDWGLTKDVFGSDDDDDLDSDAKITPRLAELGISTDIGDENDKNWNTAPAQLGSFTDIGNENGKNWNTASARQRHSKRNHFDGSSSYGFANATALADAYDGFDIMDFNRPSLNRRTKGHKGKPPVFDICDSDLNESLKAAWKGDRLKKKKRKEDRDNLRARGLLGNKSNKKDSEARHRGIIFQTVREDLKKFLVSDDAIFALPPMEKADRKAIHEIANAFKLKSNSSGNGNKRFPVLSRTSCTLPYSENIFTAVESRIAHRFPLNPKVKGENSEASKKRSRPSEINSAAVRYNDGDVVGGSAPEIGADNKGRAMLERMGWSSGTALGAANNKGILHPLTHVVKTSKAGLG